MRRNDLPERAVGRWPGILSALGVPSKYLRNRHGPCPSCGGKDRYRFDDREGRGTWICNNCGAGDGFMLLDMALGWDFKKAAQEVEAIVGDVQPNQRINNGIDEDKARDMRRKLWEGSKPIEAGSIPDVYFRSRGLTISRYPPCLRWHVSLPYGQDGKQIGQWPCIVAAVMPAKKDGVASLHRTWIAEDGQGKAPVDNPRRMMPGPMPEGGAVQLAKWEDGELGIAEGIETALAASTLYRRPVWAGLSSGMLSSWTPPEGVDSVVIFGDADPKFGGQKAAYELAHRLSCRDSINVRVELPPQIGADWLDVLTGKSDAH